MADKIKTDVQVQDQVFGSQMYSVAVTIYNMTPHELNNIQVVPKLIAGKHQITEDPEDGEAVERESKISKIIAEMESQVEKAYARHANNTMSVGKQIVGVVEELVDLYASLFTGALKRPRAFPMWASEALKISDWDDVERLETEIIAYEKDDSFLKKAFLINKDKLKRLLEKAKAAGSMTNKFDTGQILQPNSSITFPFTIQAPHLFRPRQYDIQFELSYRKDDGDKLTTQSISHKIPFFPSTFAVPTGGMLGAACGYFIKEFLLKGGAPTATVAVPTLIGSIFLGLIVALLTSRKPSSNKVITVEDFLGGFIIGALTGIFSEQMLQKLGGLLK